MGGQHQVGLACYALALALSPFLENFKGRIISFSLFAVTFKSTWIHPDNYSLGLKQTSLV